MHRPDGSAARIVATKPVGPRPAGAGDRPRAKRLDSQIGGMSHNLFVVKTARPTPGSPKRAGCELARAASSASRNRLPSGIALGYIRVIACGIGTIVPGLAGERLVVVIIAVIRVVCLAIRIRIVSPPQPRHPTTSRSARCASHGTSEPPARRRNHCAGPRKHPGTRRCEIRPRETHQIRHCRGNPRLRHRHALRRRSLAGRAQQRTAEQLQRSSEPVLSWARLYLFLSVASTTPFHTTARRSRVAAACGFAT
jgi:hypothetical protein